MFRFDCYYAAVDAFHQQCFNVGRNDWALRQLTVFVYLCQVGRSTHSLLVRSLPCCRRVTPLRRSQRR